MKISPPAFPTYLAENMAHGMTLRDYFAAAALQSVLNSLIVVANKRKTVIDNKEVATVAYGIADAILAERDK
jgi:hypothetical protein